MIAAGSTVVTSKTRSAACQSCRAKGSGRLPASITSHLGPGREQRQLCHQAIPGMLRRVVPADQFPRTGQDLHAGRAGMQDLGQGRLSGQGIGQRRPRCVAAPGGIAGPRRRPPRRTAGCAVPLGPRPPPGSPRSSSCPRLLCRQKRRSAAARPPRARRMRRRCLADEGSKFGGLIHESKKRSKKLIENDEIRMTNDE